MQDDQSLGTWRRQHSSVRELRKEGGKGAQRRDCSVGSLPGDFDFRERGILRVTFIGRMMPDTLHSKAGNMNNCLFNEGADGTYVLILDNDMKPYPKLFDCGAVVLLLGRRGRRRWRTSVQRRYFVDPDVVRAAFYRLLGTLRTSSVDDYG